MGGAGFGGGVFFEEVADFEVEVWKVCCASKPVVVGIYVGKAMILRPLRTVSRLLNWDLPPVASQRYSGMRAEQMMADFGRMASGEPMRATEVAKALELSSGQKAAALLNAMEKEGKVAKVKGEKGVSLFTLLDPDEE